MDNELKFFSVSIYGNLEPFNEVISKARVRIFYKGFNRNGTYITDEYAEKLISTLPYAPIKGIFDEEENDFTDHGNKRTAGKAYGVVPNPSNFAWEKHLDEDGVEREYACADVLLWTGIYEEAKLISGKSQSMELYEPSIKGSWEIINGRKAYVFTDGVFLGLQALGDNVEPCFEGAAFYSLYESFNDFIKEIEKFNLNNFKAKQEEKSKVFNFKLSDTEKYNAIWSLLNLNYNEQGGWEVAYAICDVYDEYAVAYNYGEHQYERVYYIKDDNTDSLSITNTEKCFILDVSESEMNALEALKSYNNNTYEDINVAYEANANLVQVVSDKEESINTLNATCNSLNEEINIKNNEISTLTQEVENLREYKLTIENSQKKEIISKYQNVLDDEIISNYTEEVLSTYSITDLEKELSYEYTKANVEIFSKKETTVVPKPENFEFTGIEKILEKYKH